jgi:hypothetical protein
MHDAMIAAAFVLMILLPCLVSKGSSEVEE